MQEMLAKMQIEVQKNSAAALAAASPTSTPARMPDQSVPLPAQPDKRQSHPSPRGETITLDTRLLRR